MKNIAVIGAGTMGVGIAQVAAQSGHKVILVDTKEEAIQKKELQQNLGQKRWAKKILPKAWLPERATV